MPAKNFLLPIALAFAIAPAAFAGSAVFPPDTGHENHAGLTFSPDGTTAYWAAWDGMWGKAPTSPRIIYQSSFSQGSWSVPEPMPFSGEFHDDEPFVSPDGRWLYFVSDRPPAGSHERRSGDLWRHSLKPPHQTERLEISSHGVEYSPVVTESGALYFASTREGGMGQGDLWRAQPVDDDFSEPKNLGPAVNSATGEWNLWVSPDESLMLFEASSRPSNQSVPGDLYFSRNSPSGWSAAIPVPMLNSSASELLPRRSPDGTRLWFTRGSSGQHARFQESDWAELEQEIAERSAPTLVVANRSSHEITFVDLAAARVVARMETGEGPHLLSNVENGALVVTGFGEFPEPHEMPVTKRPPFVTSLNSRLQWVDLYSRQTRLDLTLPDCARPHASWIVDQNVWVTCQDEQQVLEVDLKSGSILRRLDTGESGAHVLAFDEGTRTLSVSNTESGSVTLIDVDRGAVRNVSLGGGSEGALAHDGRFWVANTWDGTVSIVDPESGIEVHETDKLCGFPISLDADPLGRVWIACFGSSELIALDEKTLEETARIVLESQPLHLLIHPRAAVAWLSLPRENAVVEVALHAGAVTRRIPVGIEPDGLRWVE